MVKHATGPSKYHAVVVVEEKEELSTSLISEYWNNVLTRRIYQDINKSENAFSHNHNAGAVSLLR